MAPVRGGMAGGGPVGRVRGLFVFVVALLLEVVLCRLSVEFCEGRRGGS